MPTQTSLPLLPIQPPAYCEYAGGPCDQSFDGIRPTDGFAIYGSDPPLIAGTIEGAIRRVQQHQQSKRWTTWRDLNIPGQIVFCSICKALRSN